MVQVLVMLQDNIVFSLTFFEVLRLVSTEEVGVLVVLHFGYIIWPR
jgi:hypothetical protein